MAFPLANAHGLASAFFQAIGKAREALFLSSLRIYVLLLPGLLILPAFYGLKGLWLAFPIADTGAFIIVMILLLRERRRLVMQEQAQLAQQQILQQGGKP